MERRIASTARRSRTSRMRATTASSNAIYRPASKVRFIGIKKRDTPRPRRRGRGQERVRSPKWASQKIAIGDGRRGHGNLCMALDGGERARRALKDLGTFRGSSTALGRMGNAKSATGLLPHPGGCLGRCDLRLRAAHQALETGQRRLLGQGRCARCPSLAQHCTARPLRPRICVFLVMRGRVVLTARGSTDGARKVTVGAAR